MRGVCTVYKSVEIAAGTESEKIKRNMIVQ